MNNDLVRAAREVIRREMRQYDTLAQAPRLRYERAINDGGLDAVTSPTHSCAHGVLLHKPCTKCERDEQDCKVYETSMLFRLKELLSDLD